MAKRGREATKRYGKAPKAAVIAEVASKLEISKDFVLLQNKGLTYSQATAVRAQSRQGKVYLKVVKNTLLKRAFDQAGIDHAPLEGLLQRETMIAIGLEDPITPAKILVKYAESNPEKIAIKGGYLDGKVLSEKDVVALSKLPGREELLGRLLGSMQAPIQNTVYALNAAVSKVVWAVEAIRKQKEEAA